MPLKQFDNHGNCVDVIYTQEELDKAVKEEREVCAMVCEDTIDTDEMISWNYQCAEAIRARTNK